MRFLTVSFTAVAAALLLSGSPALAADAPADQTPEQVIAELKSRLNLTAEQEAQIKPLAETRRTKLQALKPQMQSATTRRDKGKVMREAKQIQDNFVAAVEPILTTDQRSEWKKMRDEGREQMKQRLRDRQTSQ